MGLGHAAVAVAALPVAVAVRAGPVTVRRRVLVGARGGRTQLGEAGVDAPVERANHVGVRAVVLAPAVELHRARVGQPGASVAEGGRPSLENLLADRAEVQAA